MKSGGGLPRDPAAAPFTEPGTSADRSFMPQREHHDLLFNTWNARLLLFSFLIAVTKYLTRNKMKGVRVQRNAAHCGWPQHSTRSLGWLPQLQVVLILVNEEAKR